MADDADGIGAYSVALSTVLARRHLGLTAVVEVGDPGVSWAVASELVDPTPYLNGGELLLTAGVNLPADDAGLRSYVTALAEVGVSALGFGVTPVHDTVPAALAEQCRSQGLPLIEVPRLTPFAAVSRAVGEALEELRLRELQRLGDAHRDMARAVTADRPVDRILRVLASSLDAWALLTRPAASGDAETGAPAPVSATAGAPTAPDEELRTLAARLTEPSGPRSAKARTGGEEVFLHTVGTPPQEHGVLMVGRPRPLGITERAVLRTATALIDLVGRTVQDTQPVPGHLLAGLLLDGGPTEETEPLLSELTGATGRPAAYRVLHAAADARHTPASRLPLDTRVIGTRPDGTLRAVLADRGEEVHRADLDQLLLHGWTGALSGPVAAGELTEAQRHAAALLLRARTMGEPLLWEEDRDPFDALLSSADAAELARNVLGPLAGDDENARTLRRTLQAWLTRHGNWDRTAADLNAHRNSVRYRIGRIERELGVDLADPEQRMRLWFALTRSGEG
ncbi:PucR family transcriptional regulator [Nocardiopsis algeriensis]|uniref:PucR family transcriptional regulator n=1 Tax=Nocardiopsis algeriensis TaxID=1478215 RepID=UPI003B43D48E